MSCSTPEVENARSGLDSGGVEQLRGHHRGGASGDELVGIGALTPFRSLELLELL